MCKKHGVRYAYYPTFFSNWFSTIKYIQDAGTHSEKSSLCAFMQ